MHHSEITIISVIPGSPADRAGVRPDDRLLKWDGAPLDDVLDLHVAMSSLPPEETVELAVQRNGGIERLRLLLTPDEPAGWEFAPMPVRTCHCDCQFCFVRQLPPGLRPSLYIKDEDYRYSFLHGSYLTLVGFTSCDLERVHRLGLSPLYVSIHDTDPIRRGKLLGVKSAPILPMLKRLSEAGITIHGQIVLTPGWNDGAVLEESLSDLAPLFPGLASLSIVPVGLTGHRRGLADLRALDRSEARQTLALVRRWQRRMMREHGSRWVFPADELILLAGARFPSHRAYEGYPQLENGVGIVRTTLQQANTVLRRSPRALPRPRRLLWVTGKSAAPILQTLARRFQTSVQHLKIEVLAVRNSLLGESVTVAGLLAGADILRTVQTHLSDSGGYDVVCLPPDCLNADGKLLDDWTVGDLSGRLRLPVAAFDGGWRKMLLEATPQ